MDSLGQGKYLNIIYCDFQKAFHKVLENSPLGRLYNSL